MVSGALIKGLVSGQYETVINHELFEVCVKLVSFIKALMYILK